MGCTSIQNLNLNPCKPIIAGVSKLYLLRADDILPLVDGTDYTLTNNVITNLKIRSSSFFVEIGLIKNALEVVEANVPTNYGSSFLTQEVTLKLAGIHEGNQKFIKQVRSQNLVVLATDRNGKHFILGLKKNLRMTNYQGSTGFNRNDNVGYTITFTASDLLGLKPISNDLVEIITTPTTNVGFPYTLSFQLG